MAASLLLSQGACPLLKIHVTLSLDAGIGGLQGPDNRVCGWQCPPKPPHTQDEPYPIFIPPFTWRVATADHTAIVSGPMAVNKASVSPMLFLGVVSDAPSVTKDTSGAAVHALIGVCGHCTKNIEPHTQRAHDAISLLADLRATVHIRNERTQRHYDNPAKVSSMLALTCCSKRILAGAFFRSISTWLDPHPL